MELLEFADASFEVTADAYAGGLKEKHMVQINTKESIFLHQDNYEKANELFLEIKESLDKHFIDADINVYLTPMFIHKIYTAILSNIVMCYYFLGKYEDAIYYADIAIAYSMKNYVMRHFQIVLDFKARALYYIGEFKESARLFQTAIVLYKMDEGYEDYLKDLYEIIANEFPLVKIL